MRDLIVRALKLVSALFGIKPGRHSEEYLADQTFTLTDTAPASPWTRPWAGPSATEVREIFHAEETFPLTPEQRERRWALQFADIGIEYPYRYPGDQFAVRAVAA
ncbi:MULTISPECIES: hypothetical protein [Streptomyces]|uniref:hypothetical protein n=1 Tax=Streptomyces TaxID=1883 RepID=UPI00069C86BE|nr:MULTISPECIES: hypothetical protein [Streptomyces]MYU51294.1 hypothetical protein [Streptomyces sp. SID7805]WSK14032.1 hypothetical protein OG717_21090 [Streptomyces celluloflavus]